MLFESKKDPEVQPQAPPQVRPQVQPVVPGAAHDPRQGQARVSVIGPKLTIVGKLVSEGDIQVDGRVDGEITCRSLTMGVDPVVNASVNAESACISGTYKGEIRAETVMLTKDAKMTGDIWQQTLVIEKGAILEGAIRRLQNG